MDTLTAQHKHQFISGLKETSVQFPATLKKQAVDLCATLELPTTRDEFWKYTRLGRIKNTVFTHASGSLESIDIFRIISGDSLVFINGEYSANLSSIENAENLEVEILSNSTISSDLELEGDLFSAINTAYLNDGVSISVKKNASIEKPVQILHILTGEQNIANFRIQINAGENSSASFVIGYFSDQANKSFSNVINEIKLEKNSQLTLDKIQFEDDSCFNITTEKVKQDRDSTFTINTYTLSGGLVRNNLLIDVDGENCETNLNGAYILKDNQHVDNHTVVDQKVANCQSNELYKGVIDDKATAVFNGKVFVRKDAQKVNAFQSNGNVLLSDSATVNSKPELEIYADDVKCSHGSTIGQLDDEAVFYLRSRGISEESAKQLMVAAFIEDTFKNVKNQEVLDYVHDLIRKRFGWMI